MQNDDVVSQLCVLCDVLIFKFDLGDCLLLMKYLDFFAEKKDVGAETQVLLQNFIKGLQQNYRRDPADYAVLYVLALRDLSNGETQVGIHKLKKLANSGCPQHRQARAKLMDISSDE